MNSVAGPPAAPERSDDLPRGALFAVLAAAAFAVMAACVKAASHGIGNPIIVFFRSSVGLLVLLPWLLRHGLAAIKTTRPGGHLWRVAFGICAMYAFFYAIAHLHLAEAIVLTYSTPLFIPFIAWAFIREPPTALILAAVTVGLFGIALIAKPESGPLNLATAVGVFSSICAAAAMVTIRNIADTEPAVRIVFYFSALSTLISSVPLIWSWQTPTAPQLLLLVGIGVFATLGQLCLTRAYSLAPAARIGPFTYFAAIFGGLIGWAVWHEQPDAASIAGMLLVVACCLLASWRPSRKSIA